MSELKEDAYKLTHSHKGGTDHERELQKLHADEALLKEDVFCSEETIFRLQKLCRRHE